SVVGRGSAPGYRKVSGHVGARALNISPTSRFGGPDPRNMHGSTSMTEAAPSYTHGTSTVALIGETIGRHFDRTVARFGDRPALIACQQGIRWNYREL